MYKFYHKSNLTIEFYANIIFFVNVKWDIISLFDKYIGYN